MLITQYCLVKPPEIRLNGSVIFDNPTLEPPEFLKSAYRNLNINYPKFFKMDALSKLAFLSAEVLLKNQEITHRYDAHEIGIILQNSSSSLETDEKHQESINDRQNYFPSPSVFVYTLPNIMVGEIAIKHKIRGENTVLICERPDARQLYEYVYDNFLQNRFKCCITGRVESYHSKMSVCLMLVEKEETATSLVEPKEMCIFGLSNFERIFKKAL